MQRVRAFLAIASATPIAIEDLPARDERPPARSILWTTSADRRLAVGVCPRDESATPTAGPWLVGDTAEWAESSGPHEAMVNAATLALDEQAGTIRIGTSIVSLPPVFLLNEESRSVGCSDLHLLSRLPGIDLRFDPDGVHELGRIGFPVQGRTLFRGVRFAEAASEIRLEPNEDVDERQSWRYPGEQEALERAAFVELQIEAFRASMDRLDVSGSVLSLTGGLDTRTIFSVLAAQERLRPSVTLSGPRPSLDARIARDLCHHYDVAHQVVHFDDEFLKDLPRRVEATCRLSGGLTSLDWASEVYLYEALDDLPAARVSGNLGNQIGRGGTEGFGLRGAAIEVLAPDVRRSVTEHEGHWMDEARTTTGIETEFLLRREIPFTSVANFSIGNHFAVQQSPYADRALVETLARRPAPESSTGSSLLRLRLRDLRHRFLGEPVTHSFQRQLVSRLGGYAAHCPINWGWRASGGLSARGSVRGVLTLAGMVASSRGLDEGVLGPLLAPAVALHDFRRPRHWLRTTLREFVEDQLGSRALRQSGLFDEALLRKIVDEHFEGVRDHHDTVVFALDIALARSEFGAR